MWMKTLGYRTEYADSFWKKFRGLMFRKSLDHALVFDLGKETRHGASIHSFFVFFAFDAIFLDKNKKIVDMKTVSPFGFCIPRKPSRFIVEVPKKTIEKKNLKLGRKLAL